VLEVARMNKKSKLYIIDKMRGGVVHFLNFANTRPRNKSKTQNVSSVKSNRIDEKRRRKR